MLNIRAAVQCDAAAMTQVHRDAVFAKAAGYYPRAMLQAWAPGATDCRVARVEQEIADPDVNVLGI
jgi:hypothetical protein